MVVKSSAVHLTGLAVQGAEMPVKFFKCRYEIKFSIGIDITLRILSWYSFLNDTQRCAQDCFTSAYLKVVNTLTVQYVVNCMLPAT